MTLNELLQQEIELGVTEEALHLLNTAIANHPEEASSVSRRVYECSICGRNDVWGISWMWFGSFRESEEADRITITCSRKCFEESCRQRVTSVKTTAEVIVAMPPIQRSAEGLRDAIFDEIDALRAGTVSTIHARAIANLVRQCIDAARLDIQHRIALLSDSARRD